MNNVVAATSCTTQSLQLALSVRVPTGNRHYFPSRFKTASKEPSEPKGERPGINTIQITSMQVEITPNGSWQC